MALQSFYSMLLLLLLMASPPALATIDVDERAVLEVNSLIDPGTEWPGAATQHIDDAVRTGATVRAVASTVPEPRAWALLLAGLALVASRRHAPGPDLPFR